MPSDPITRTGAGIALIGARHAEYGRVLRANRQLADLLATAVPELEGTRICEHVHPQDQHQADDAYLRLTADPQALYENTTRMVAGDRRIVRVHTVTSLIATQGGGAFMLRVLALGD
jgi:hypothetical protein